MLRGRLGSKRHSRSSKREKRGREISRQR